ncbi:MAG: polyphosphate kinase 2 family protein [Anaerolineales bacterium]|nr:polyphosphate kinase 2 family protein [Anaerolineales bacterium]
MKRYRVDPDSKVDLDDWDAEETSAYDGDKDDGEDWLDELTDELEVLQELLYAEHKHKVLVVLQAMDTGGKDGVIRHVFEGVNPVGVRVASFKVPTPIELDHDYLWRVHQQTPGRGEIVIFNRSHYEDVLVVRVHELVSEEVWKKRYDQINEFERTLAEEGTLILKFFLHITKKEQKERLEARLEDPTKQWKFAVGDLDERKLWPQYQKAYEDVLSRTSTKWAPWYVVPSNRKWYRNLVIATIMVEALKKLKMEYPKPKDDLTGIVIE